MRVNRGTSLRVAALHGLFLLSGALGLAYEVLWMRRFAALFGSTTLAATATLSAFFLGTALGSAAFGARAGGWARPLRAFGLLEIGVGGGALLVGPILSLYTVLYPWLYAHLAAFPAGFAGAKLGLAALAVAVPTLFMGGTLPALAEGLAPLGRRLGVSVGSLYSVNVLGAALGALAVPFALLPTLGLGGSELCVVAGSLAVGLAAVSIGSAFGRSGERDPSTLTHGAAATSSGRLSPSAVLGLAAWSGLATLALEVLWTRMFSLVHENSVYSFAVVVVVFLAGLSGGAALAGIALRRGYDPRRALGWVWSAAGLLVVLSPRLFSDLTGGLQYLPAEGWIDSAARLLGLAALTLLPACTALGAALPLLMEMAGREGTSAGLQIGRLLAVNTAGAVAGPLVVTFFVAPALGLWQSVGLVGVLTAVLGCRVGLPLLPRWIVCGAVVGALLVAGPRSVPPVRVRPGERVVSVREDAYGTTAVLEDDHDRWITVNNSYVLGGAAAAGEERWQGHLPLLLHAAPRHVAFIGLGTGIAAAAALAHSVAHVVALEIVPDVVRAARQDFADLNDGVVEDPRVEVVTDDGRNYLLAAPAGGLDVVVGDLLVPWRPGESALYTREHFDAVRRVLAPGGLFCQWLPLYQLSEAQLAIVLRTFLDVFPRTTVWRGNFLPGEPTLALVGHMSASALDVDAIDRRVARLAPSVAASSPMLADPAGLWLSLVGSPGRDAPWLSKAPRNTDDHPWVELLSPRRREAIVGAPLEALLEEIAASPLQGTPLAHLDGTHRTWRGTGLSLGRASLDRGPAGEKRVLALLRTLPGPLLSALGVPPS